MKNSVLFLLIILLCYSSLAWGKDEFRDTESERIKMIRDLEANWPERLQEHLKTIAPLTIEGRVLDQNDTPVSGVEIDIHWEYFDEKKFYQTHIGTQKIKTNDDGFFTFTKEHALDLTMYDVSKKGYEFKEELSPYYQAGSGRKAMQENSVTDPIIIYMRKLNPTTFLLKSSVSYYFKEDSSTLRYTMIPGMLRPIDSDLSKIDHPELNDLIFTVIRNGDGSYTMHIQPIPDIGGSVQMLDDFLYKAPADGYESEVFFTIQPEDGKVRKYLYFTSRKAGVYSRMTMGLKADDSDNELELGSTTWTNPYGKRNLEWEPELPFDLEEKLEREAEKALKSGKLAEEPEDLAKLMEQYR